MPSATLPDSPPWRTAIPTTSGPLRPSARLAGPPSRPPSCPPSCPPPWSIDGAAVRIPTFGWSRWPAIGMAVRQGRPPGRVAVCQQTSIRTFFGSDFLERRPKWQLWVSVNTKYVKFRLPMSLWQILLKIGILLIFLVFFWGAPTYNLQVGC
jgi:hypothetical protein